MKQNVEIAVTGQLVWKLKQNIDSYTFHLNKYYIIDLNNVPTQYQTINLRRLSEIVRFPEQPFNLVFTNHYTLGRLLTMCVWTFYSTLSIIIQNNNKCDYFEEHYSINQC